MVRLYCHAAYIACQGLRREQLGLVHRLLTEQLKPNGPVSKLLSDSSCVYRIAILVHTILIHDIQEFGEWFSTFVIATLHNNPRLMVALARACCGPFTWVPFCLPILEVAQRWKSASLFRNAMGKLLISAGEECAKTVLQLLEFFPALVLGEDLVAAGVAECTEAKALWENPALVCSDTVLPQLILARSLHPTHRPWELIAKPCDCRGTIHNTVMFFIHRNAPTTHLTFQLMSGSDKDTVWASRCIQFHQRESHSPTCLHQQQCLEEILQRVLPNGIVDPNSSQIQKMWFPFSVWPVVQMICERFPLNTVAPLADCPAPFLTMLLLHLWIRLQKNHHD